MNLNEAGFFGTNADLLSDISLTLAILIALMLTGGMIMAVRKRYKVHRWIQTSAVMLNILLIIFVMAGSFQRQARPGLPQRLDEAYYQVVVVHAVTGFVAALFGTYVMLRGNELVPNFLKFKNYKPFMRTAYGLYMLATLLGLSTYYTWYITTDVAVDEGQGAVQITAEIPGELAVPIANFSFNPGELVIPVGTTLVWTNQDGAPHTATSDDGVFGSDLLGNADAFSFTFDETGEFPYFCEIHGSAGGFGMAGSINVVPADEAPEQLVAAVPEEIQPTPQPTPHPLPDVYFNQPMGTAAFRDKDARSDQLLINVTLDEPLAAGNAPFAFCDFARHGQFCAFWRCGAELPAVNGSYSSVSLHSWCRQVVGWRRFMQLLLPVVWISANDRADGVGH